MEWDSFAESYEPASRDVSMAQSCGAGAEDEPPEDSPDTMLRIYEELTRELMEVGTGSPVPHMPCRTPVLRRLDGRPAAMRPRLPTRDDARRAGLLPGSTARAARPANPEVAEQCLVYRHPVATNTAMV